MLPYPKVSCRYGARRAAPRLEDDARLAAGTRGERLKVPMNGAEMRRGRCKPRFRAPGRNVGQRRAVSGRFRRTPDAPNGEFERQSAMRRSASGGESEDAEVVLDFTQADGDEPSLGHCYTEISQQCPSEVNCFAGSICPLSGGICDIEKKAERTAAPFENRRDFADSELP